MEILFFILMAIIAVCLVVLFVVLSPAVLIVGAIIACIWILWAGLVFISKLIGG